VFNRNIGGLQITFQTVFNTLHQKGVPVFCIGGTVRDLIQDPLNSPKDVDMSFGVSSHEVINLLHSSLGIQCSPPTMGGLVVIGSQTAGNIWLEGKAIGGLNFDIVSVSTAPRSISTDLHLECLYRDFACNALCYDPINKVIIDPTGYGIEDAINKVLRIPVDLPKWDLWYNGNTTKISKRLKKFISKGYTIHTPHKQYLESH